MQFRFVSVVLKSLIFSHLKDFLVIGGPPQYPFMAWCSVKHKENFTFYHPVQTGSGAHPASSSMGTRGNFPLGVKQQGLEANHSPPSSAEVKIACSYTSTPQYAFMAWCSVKAQEQLYLTLPSYDDFVLSLGDQA